MNRRNRILWIDDEIDMLKPHILFLDKKGYDIIPAVSGPDGIDLFKQEVFDAIFIDENMPGISGLETVEELRKINTNIPIIMITKSEDEEIMVDAIGRQITDFLIKPVNPLQILSALKKNLHQSEIVSEAFLNKYRSDFYDISNQINKANTPEEWYEVYKLLIEWDIKLGDIHSPLLESLIVQKQEANSLFNKKVRSDYESWIKGSEDAPLFSHQIIKNYVIPKLQNDEQIYFVVIDNFRLDQWLAIKTFLNDSFVVQENYAYSILPTATQYARNAMFAGMLPAEIAKRYPHLWKGETEEGTKNDYEEELLKLNLQRMGLDIPFTYNKLFSSHAGDKYLNNIYRSENNPLNVLVLNFVDMLSHSKTDSKMIRELAHTESSYRSVTKTWFEHSSTLDIFKRMTKSGAKIVLTSDHGMIRVNRPLKVIGEKDLNTNLRYKVGKKIEYDRKKVYEILKPESIGLPAENVTTRYIFASNEDFFAYPNDFQYYVSHYADTFQHGGISLEEMIVPLVTISSK